MSYKISRLQDPARIPELIELFRTGLGDTTEEHWKWRLFEENGQQEKPFSIIIENEQRTIVGMICILPVIYRIGNEQRCAVQIGDWVISPQYRGKNIARKMFTYLSNYLSDKGYDFIIGFPNQFSYPVLKKYGFHDISGTTSWNSKSSLFISSKNTISEQSYQGNIYRFSDEVPDIMFNCKRDGQIIKNSAFMRWKFDKNPNDKFSWLTVWQGNICIGYFVYHLTKGRLRTAVNVYDWDVSELENTQCFAYAVKLLKSKGHFVSFWGRYHDDKKQLLSRVGLNKQNTEITCILKQISEQIVPDLELTRIDTDY